MKSFIIQFLKYFTDTLLICLKYHICLLAWKSHISIWPAPPFSPAHSNYVQTTSPMIPGVVRQEERVLAGAHTDPS